MLLPSDKSKDLVTILENGYSLFCKNWQPSLLLSFLGVASLGLSLFLKIQFSFPAPVNWLIPIVGLILSQVFFGGLVFHLYSSNKKTPSSIKNSLYIGIEKLPAFSITLFIYILMVFIGTVAFVLPGIYLSIACVFAFILLYTDNHDPILSLTTSYKLCQKHFLSVSVILLTLSLFSSLGNLLGLAMGYILFTLFNLNSTPLFFTNLILLCLINILLIPIAYSVMLSLLQELKTRHAQH
jgi:hypothetical protein